MKYEWKASHAMPDTRNNSVNINVFVTPHISLLQKDPLHPLSSRGIRPT